MKKNIFYAQSGGVTPVINATAAGLIDAYKLNKNLFGKLYIGKNGIAGALNEELIDVNKLKCHGWGQQAEILTYAINKKTKIFEIGINYHGRTYDEGKKIRYYDVFNVIYWIIISRLKKIFL